MVLLPPTPRRSATRRPRRSASVTRSRRSSSSRTAKPLSLATPMTEPPPKRRKYIPGGPGGGGRYVDENGAETPVGGTGPGGYNYTGPKGRIGRENAKNGVRPVTYPRRERSTRTRTVMPRSQQPAMRFSSAAQVAAAVVQSDGYKPREERGWEEFHPDLDVDAKFACFSADEVDGIVAPTTPQPLAEITPATPGSEEVSLLAQRSIVVPGVTPGTKRRPGRPPRDPVAFYTAREAASLGVPHVTPIAPRTPKTPLMPLQTHHSKERLTLPNPSYRRTDALSRFEDKATGQARYVDKSMANVGYQESDIFLRNSRTLIKLSDYGPDEDLDLALAKSEGENQVAVPGGVLGRVEYDMDEQDDRWLSSYNAYRKTVDAEPITREVFEITITKIEKEWHALEKRIPKPNPKPPQTHRPRSSSAAAVNGEPSGGEEQDSKCAICDDGDCENTNAIVFCDGCDLAVHQECYGVPFIPEGQWLCRKCQLIGRGIPTCIFCPNTDGAFKQTNASKWAHLLCAMWIPEVSLGNHTFMEPVMDVEKVPKTRWKLTCYICRQRMGACIQCGNKSCYQAFHVTCARRARLYLKMKNSHGTLAVLDGSTVLKAFCDKHCPSEYSKENDVAHATRDARIFYKRTMRGRIWADSQAAAAAIAATQRNAITENQPDKSQAIGVSLGLPNTDPKRKGNQPQKAIWKLPSGAPVIPATVFDTVESSLQRFPIRKRKDFTAQACRYWTLKRESRRGAALLKRLQLQLETFTSMELTRRNFASMGQVGKSRLQRRIEFAEQLINDLEQLKALSDDTRHRELEKLRQAEMEEEAVDNIYFPIARLLPPIIERAIVLDIKSMFMEGLLKLQTRLSERYYVLASGTFAHDLCQAIRTGIDALPRAKADDGVKANGPLSRPEIVDLKERRKLGRRILKSAQPALEAAIRGEAELCKKSAEVDIKELDAMIEAAIDISAALNRAGDNDGLEDLQSHRLTNGDNGDKEAGTANADPMDLDEDAPGEIDDSAAFGPSDHADAEDDAAALDAQLNQHMEDAAQEAASKPFTTGIKSTHTPPDTNGYISAAAEHQPPPPPTPPVSNGGAGSLPDIPTDLLSAGGVPWYLRVPFDPVGTTVSEQQWTGRDVVRGLSEELSELDDDALKGLGVDVEGMGGDDVEMSTAPIVPTSATSTPARTRKGKVKKRWRGFR